MKDTGWGILKRKWTLQEDGGVAGAVLAIFVAIVLLVGFVVMAVKFGYSLSSIITAFHKFFGMSVTLGGR